jgi:predicted ArsR family transcriptional regulator
MVQFRTIHDREPDVIETWPMFIEPITNRVVMLVESDDEAAWVMHQHHHDAVVQVRTSSSAQTKYFAIPLRALFHIGHSEVKVGNGEKIGHRSYSARSASQNLHPCFRLLSDFHPFEHHRTVAFALRMALNGSMATRHLPDYRTLASLSRVNLLHELQQRGAKTITELAEATGLHHNTAREHLHRLIDAGFVDSEPVPSVSKGRPKLRYRAARDSDNPARVARLRSSERRTELLRRMLPPAEATVERTPLERQFDALDDHMDQCGFDAEIDVDNSRMSMHDCPFADLAKENPQVCQVHFELVQDALDIEGGPLKATELHAFYGPKLCIVNLKESVSDSD